MKLLLLGGAIASGKSTIASGLRERGWVSAGTGTFLHDRLVSSGATPSRHALQELGDALDAETDFRWPLLQVLQPRLAAEPHTTRWLVDAVRKRGQLEHFRDHFPGAVRFVFVDLPLEERRRRFLARAAETEESFFEATSHPNEVEASSLGASADLVVFGAAEVSQSVAKIEALMEVQR
jgi:gluconate kinase